MKKVNILNVSLDNISMSELLKALDLSGGVVFTPNVDHLIKLQKNYDFNKAYSIANYKVCDSKVLMYASKFLGSPLKEKISGSDLFPAFYEYHKNNESIKIFLLGAAEGVARKAQEKINRKVGREIVVGSYSPPFGFEKDEREALNIIERINESGATVLAIGVGAPKQEKWLLEYKEKLKNIKIFLAIGATIDFEAGHKPRSPKWMSELGVEWLFRLQSEPQRLWKRYLLEDTAFFWLILKQKLNLYRAPLATYDAAVKEATPKAQNLKPIGQLLQQANLLSPDQVATVLQEQAKQKQHQRFGEILVRLGWLNPKTVDFFAEELPKLPTTSYRQPLGQYLKSAGLLNDAQINTILNYQAETGLRFGEIAVSQGWVKQETINFLLHYISPNQMLVPVEASGNLTHRQVVQSY
ncbi:MAG: WecB/TagA/CpsF family glycosyltransferase [Microcoleus vaginatus WJT46-NPBG5]|jgi:exopolysaccharide biosynthesis WecB/TagA/CpsF family protein|nr:WecB/TagA/CpsF family glycosyltransferase [Microcoleus vaginatus WJT46-NPBG5]